ncbi:hypothetical protein SEVCU116_0142 [Staphylococcus capitis VCU116]|nr:hypothetical protein SEVCU116_0142 [Staphylococcus capitis VCU116]
MENIEIYKIFELMGLFSIIIFLFFTFSLIFQKIKKGREV